MELRQGLCGVLMQPVHEMASMKRWYGKFPSPGICSYFITRICTFAFITITIRVGCVLVGGGTTSHARGQRGLTRALVALVFYAASKLVQCAM